MGIFNGARAVATAAAVGNLLQGWDNAAVAGRRTHAHTHTHTPYSSAPPPHHQNPKPKTDFLNKVRTAQSPSQSFVGDLRCFAVESFSIIPHGSKYPKSSEVPESFSHCSERCCASCYTCRCTAVYKTRVQIGGYTSNRGFGGGSCFDWSGGKCDSGRTCS